MNTPSSNGKKRSKVTKLKQGKNFPVKQVTEQKLIDWRNEVARYILIFSLALLITFIYVTSDQEVFDRSVLILKEFKEVVKAWINK